MAQLTKDEALVELQWCRMAAQKYRDLAYECYEWRGNRYWCAKNGFSRWGGDQNWVRRYNRKLTRKHWRSCLQEVGKVDFNPWYGWYGEIEREDPLELLEKEEKRLWGYSRIIKN